MGEKRNKLARKETMLDFIKANQNGDPVQKQVNAAQSNINAYKYTPEYQELLTNYNKDVTILDKMYTNVQPLHEILVRFFVHEPTKIGELVQPYKVMVPIKTKSGVDSYQDMETDHPYMNKAVVISAPESNQLKPGDIVVLSQRAIQMVVIGNGANAVVRVDTGFVHPDAGLHEVPTDPSNEHYGYALVPYHEVKAKLTL